jgi:hypothetical protein
MKISTKMVCSMPIAAKGINLSTGILQCGFFPLAKLFKNANVFCSYTTGTMF